MYFDTPHGLADALDEDLFRVMSQAGKDMRDKYRQLLLETVYSDTPKYYVRTFELLDATTSDMSFSSGHPYDTSVYIDPDNMTVSQQVYPIRKRNARNGRMITTHVMCGVHADNLGNDVREDVIGYVLGGSDPSTPYAYTRNGKKGGLHRYPGHEDTHVNDLMYEWLMYEYMPMMLNDAFPAVNGSKVAIYRKR